jgi:capsid assembly protease
MKRHTAQELIAAQTWAIDPAMLETMMAIATRSNGTPEAVEAEIGRPLQNSRTATVRDGGVAVIPITGPIFRRASMFTRVSGATSIEALALDIGEAEKNPEVKAIVLDIDSPGGQVTGTAELAQMIRATSKPVVAYIDGAAASAAYWIASAADRIVMSKTAEVGSIGVVTAYRTSKATETETEIEIVSSQSPLKRATPETEEGRALAQARVDEIADIFIADVAAYRGTTIDKVLADFGQGSTLIAARAVATGMADSVSTLETLIDTLSASKPPLTRRPPHMTALTREMLAADHVDLLAEIETAAEQRGITAERARIVAIEAAALPGHDALIAALKADGTDATAAMTQILAAEKTRLTTLGRQHAIDAPAPVAFAAASDDSGDHRPLEDRCKSQWEASNPLRAEFQTLAAYTAYVRATESGSARIITKSGA